MKATRTLSSWAWQWNTEESLIACKLGRPLKKPASNRTSRDKSQIGRVAPESMTVTVVSARISMMITGVSGMGEIRKVF